MRILNFQKNRLFLWIKRYLPLEIAGTCMALTVAAVAQAASNNEILVAYAGTWGENLGFYGYAGLRELIQYNKSTSGESGIWRSLRMFFKAIRNILLEFGPSEILDSFVLRPFFMYIFQVLLGSFVLGIIIGKIAADVVFYLIAVIAYESRKRYMGE